MNAPASCGRLAVCSWSLQPSSPQDLITKLSATGLRRIQLALGPLRTQPAIWADAGALLKAEGVEIVSGMFGCAGEDYSTLDSIRETGGIMPDHTWQQNLASLQATSNIARELGLKLVTLHAGFLPPDESGPGYAKMLGRLGVVADLFSAANLEVALETGQEAAVPLANLWRRLGRTNVGVNFDPANMILYGQGDPVAAVRVLGPLIRQVHLKDANRTLTPGAWGQEVPVGKGQVDWPTFFSALKAARFAGNFVIEREAGGRRPEDICAARDLFLKLNP